MQKLLKEEIFEPIRSLYREATTQSPVLISAIIKHLSLFSDSCDIGRLSKQLFHLFEKRITELCYQQSPFQREMYLAAI